MGIKKIYCEVYLFDHNLSRYSIHYRVMNESLYRLITLVHLESLPT